MCRAKLYEMPDRRNPSRMAQKGWKCCNRCTTCSYSENKTSVLVSATKERIPIHQTITCKTCGVLYVVECTKCPERPQYIGKTGRSLMIRGREHVYNINKKKTEGSNRSTTKMYSHFSTNGHTSRDLIIYGIEQVFGDEFTQQAKERLFINRFDSVRKGLKTYRT